MLLCRAAYIPGQVGCDDGAVLLTGGRRPHSCPHGYFLQPTVFIKVTPNMRIWKEEIFGPVLSGGYTCLDRPNECKCPRVNSETIAIPHFRVRHPRPKGQADCDVCLCGHDPRRLIL